MRRLPRKNLVSKRCLCTCALLVSTWTQGAVVKDSFVEAICFRQMCAIWGGAESYRMGEAGRTNHNWNDEMVNPSMLIKAGYVSPGLGTCPLGTNQYALFKVTRGPACPHGHTFGDKNSPAEGDFARLLWIGADESHGLEELMKAAQSPHVIDRRLCAMAIGLFFPKKPVEVQALVKTLLGDPDFVVRALAVEQIENAGLSEALLKRALEDVVPLVRATAAKVCANWNKKGMMGSLVGLLHDEEQRVRDAALFALEQITGQSFGPNEEKWRTWLRERLELTGESNALETMPNKRGSQNIR